MQDKSYSNHPAMRQSSLKVILDGIEEFKWKLDHPEESTEAQKLGTAVHLLLLEPHKIDCIVKMPKLNGATREGKIFKLILEGRDPNFFPLAKGKIKKQEKGLFYEVDHEELSFIQMMQSEYARIVSDPGKFILLDEDTYDKAHRMADAVRENDDSRHILECCTHFEQVLFFTYRGIEFKCQLDGRGNAFILDLKTTIIPNNDFAIRREIQKRRYHFQASAYLKGVPEMLYYYVLFVRNEPPYAVFPIQMPEDLLLEGAMQFDKACDIYSDCLINNPEFKPNNRLRLI